MGSLKSLAQGFLVAVGLIWLFNIVDLILAGDRWLGIVYLLIMLIPISTIVILKHKNLNKPAPKDMAKWRNLLFSFQGVALAFWLFDIATTFYAINITGLAIELNPLGWPWGILGALAFYGPTMLFSYILLFKQKENFCVYAAIPLTFITLGMSTMNLIAGAQNFQVFIETAALATNIRYGFLAVVLTLNLAVPLTLNRWVKSLYPRLNVKKP